MSVVIPTHDRSESLLSVLKPLLEDDAVAEVITIVDGGSDGSFDCVSDLGRSNPRLRVEWQPHSGPAAARQRGLELARYDVVLFLDDDVVPEPGLVAGHAAHHKEVARQVVCGYMPIRVDVIEPGDRAAAVIYRTFYDRTCERWADDPHSVLLTFWGGNFSLRRSDALAVGLALPETAMLVRGEDREFGLRCAEAGLSGKFDRSLAADHRFRRSLNHFRRDMRASGLAVHVIHQLHPHLIAPDGSVRGADGSVSPSRHPLVERARQLLLPWLAVGARYRVTVAALLAIMRVGSFTHVFALELLAARILGAVESRRGYMLAAAARFDVRAANHESSNPADTPEEPEAGPALFRAASALVMPGDCGASPTKRRKERTPWRKF